MYQLTLETNTYFYKYPPVLPSDDAIFQSLLACQNQLAVQGYEQYQISAYALADKQSRHNKNYWSFGDYLDIVAGAPGKITRILPNKIVQTQKPSAPSIISIPLKMID